MSEIKKQHEIAVRLTVNPMAGEANFGIEEDGKMLGGLICLKTGDLTALHLAVQELSLQIGKERMKREKGKFNS